MARPSRGLSLIEVMTGAFVASLVLSVILTIFLVGRRVWHSAHSSMLLSREMGTAMLLLRRDLEDTSLSSVAVRDGLSMATARDKDGTLQLTPAGAPRWTGHVLYTLEPAGPNRANLVRWMRSEPAVAPWPSRVPPWPVREAVRQQVLMRNLLPPRRALREVEGRWTVVDQAGSPGGLAASFVRRGPEGRSLSTHNPTAFTDNQRAGWCAGNTLLVQVDLTVLEVNSETGAVNSMDFQLRVVPRN